MQNNTTVKRPGQRWLWDLIHHTILVELIELLAHERLEDSWKVKVLFAEGSNANDVGKIKSYPFFSTHWVYLEGQDKPQY